jgi:quercetin dioxygenase-like cupin family protein
MPTIRSALCAILIAAAFGGPAFIAAPARAELNPAALQVIPFDTLKFKGEPGSQQTAVVFGDPAKPGLYGIVIKWPPHTNSRPHSHPNDRYVTVLSGVWWVNTGPRFTPDTMVAMRPGAFVIHYANQIHYDGAKDDPAMIYIVGMGPAPSIDREEK